jgi:hypothetical protein
MDSTSDWILFYGVGRMTVFGMFFTNIGKCFGYTHYMERLWGLDYTQYCHCVIIAISTLLFSGFTA